MQALSPIVFLDRDGTINVDTGYPCDPERLELIPKAADGLAMLKKAGFRLIVVTNQAAIGRGLATEEQVRATNAGLRERLRAAHPEALIDEVYYCPHHPDDQCECRKPRIGMIARMIERGHFDPNRAWIIGDKLADLTFGANAGIPAAQRLLVLTGKGQEELERARTLPEFEELQFFPALTEAAQWIVDHNEQEIIK